MPVGNFVNDMLERRHQARIKRQEDKKKLVSLLPPELYEMVWQRARDQAKKIVEWEAELDGEIARVEAQLKEERKAVFEMCPHSYDLPQVKGPRGALAYLFDFELTEPKPRPDRRQLTPEALKQKNEKVLPLQRRLASLRHQKARCEQNLWQLAKIAEASMSGNVALIHYLSAQWSSVLEIGAGAEGTAAKLISYRMVPADAAGNALPAQALDADGQPDLPKPQRIRA